MKFLKHIVILLTLAIASSVHSATFYIATNGSDSGSGSISSPFKTAAKAYSVMAGGDTAIIRNGNYPSLQLISRTVFPPAGNANAWTKVVAESMGGVTINGGSIFMDGPATGAIRYVAFDGLAFRKQNPGTQLYGVDHIKFFRCGFEDGADGNGMTFNLHRDCSYILAEDCYFWGSGRYKLATYHANHIVFRRPVVRIDRVNATPDPMAGVAIYASDSVEIQNAIVIDGDKPANWLNVNEYSGAFSTPSTDGPSTNITYNGCLALNVDMQFGTVTKNVNNLKFINCVGWHLREGVWARDSASYDRCTFGDFYGPSRQTFSMGMRFEWGDDPVNSTKITNSILTGIKGTALWGWSSEDSNIFWQNTADRANTPTGSKSKNANPNLKYIVRSDAAAGASITKRVGKSGTLWGEAGYADTTSEDLWPWPNEQVIGSMMRSYSYQSLSGNRGFAATGQTLTNYVWTYLGSPNPISNVPATEPSQPPVTQPSTIPATSPATSPTSNPSTSPSTVPTTSPTTAPATSPSTNPTTQPGPTTHPVIHVEIDIDVITKEVKVLRVE